MSDAIAFLHALAQALSMVTLYAPGHPATRRASENLWQAARALLAADARPVFLFLGTAPVYNGRALQELREWHHSGRLAAAGIQRLEFDSALTEESVAALVERLMQRLAGAAGDVEESTLPGVVFGTVAVDSGSDGSDATGSHPLTLEEAEAALDFRDELAAMVFIRDEARLGNVARAEADALVRVLGALVDKWYLPQVPRGEIGALHDAERTLNAAMLVLACGVATAIDGPARQRLGLAALLRGIRPRRAPGASGAAAAESPSVGAARLLLDAGGAGCELAAIVAYQWPARADGRGDLVLPEAMTVQWSTRLIQVAEAFAGARHPAGEKQSLSVDETLGYLAGEAGASLDAESVALVSRVVRPG